MGVLRVFGPKFTKPIQQLECQSIIAFIRIGLLGQRIANKLIGSPNIQVQILFEELTVQVQKYAIYSVLSLTGLYSTSPSSADSLMGYLTCFRNNTQRQGLRYNLHCSVNPKHKTFKMLLKCLL